MCLHLLPRPEAGGASPSHGEGGLALASRGEPYLHLPLAGWPKERGRKKK